MAIPKRRLIQVLLDNIASLALIKGRCCLLFRVIGVVEEATDVAARRCVRVRVKLCRVILLFLPQVLLIFLLVLAGRLI